MKSGQPTARYGLFPLYEFLSKAPDPRNRKLSAYFIFRAA